MAEETIKSVERSIRIMEFIRSGDGASIEEILSEFDVSKSTAHRHLKTLEKYGFVVKEDGDHYIGLRALRMSRYAVQRKSAYKIAGDITNVIANETGDRVVFATEENGRGVVLSTEVGEHGIFADIKVGQRVPLHGTAAGKAMLAKMPRHRVEEILDRHGMPALTEKTITDRETLFTELDQIREQGYSINNAERIDGVRAVGVAVEDEDETVIGAFITSGPTRRISDERIEDELAETLLSAAEEFELRNRYSETS